ncbi:hypothetical protein DM867_04040 [Halosegnis rubeus]|jgi:hypothetical protein|uniref:Uncharacterized protein n=1 Tax=Halosegnis rubeus TaxID=2212850 RepID=A0A5N5UG50_9EURY|nr:hypothetical protein [Halosegnis rubeus]KAB7515254.1 hypothetical protein DMP03_08420 [Halosegnis rubeus]KAB7516308.1 hypothetical protein DM867_04040 [Halosegnis rubeus]KAB7517704.1 hypothetical protein DP108_09080 [Halosegnis rubeus]
MDAAALVDRLDRFGGSDAERRAVARQARDLADSGAFASDAGYELTPAVVIEHLVDAPDGGPADRWNWWLGSLEAAHGAYRRFQVERWQER